MMKINRHSKRHGTLGFTLIEVLVSLVVLSVGLLGIAGMISVSLKSSGSTYTRTQVTAFTSNILDRMRANRTSARGNGYDTAFTDTIPSSYKDKCLGSSASCSVSDLAKFDLYQWKADLAAQLPDGKGSIVTVGVGNMTQVTITIQWNDARAQQALGETSSSSPAPSSLSITTSL
jgi:type IV pilus assembly protein PilV